MRLVEIIIDLPELRRYAHEVIAGGGVLAVYLVGSAQDSASPNDIDILYDLDYNAPPDADDDDPDLIRFLEGTRIDHGAFDTFYKAGNMYWHLTWGAGASMIRNDDYAREQAHRPKTLLASR